MTRLGQYLFIAAVMLPAPAGAAQRHGSASAPPVTRTATSADKKFIRSAAEQEMFDLLNLEREKAGLSRLAWNDQLAQAAREHARLLAANRTLSHQFPSEASLTARLAASGSRFTAAAENVATAASAEEAHSALMHSPGHRANIMSPDYNAAGVGVVEVQGRLFVTQDFATAIRIYTEVEFRDALIASVTRARKSKGMAPLDTRADPALHSAACSTNGDPQSVLAGIAAPAQVLTFTLSEPEKLPDSLTKYLEAGRWRRMGVGVCYRPDRTYGYGNFWVVVAFGN